ncbi:MAG: crossover junction endodeoxyribonuclease RuvC [Balneolales bacterium]
MTTKILGIDPGSRITGYAVLEHHDRSFRALCCDVLRLTDTENSFDRLTLLYSEFNNILTTWHPDYCAIETPIYGKDPSAMLKLGRAQAVIIIAVLHHQIPLFEYYPKAVKKSITGTGNARKDQVAYMLHKMIDLPKEKLPNDATDALAVAWCHFQKLTDPGPGDKNTGINKSSKRRNTWSSFVDNHPERVRKS